MKCSDQNQGDFYGMESWGKSVYQEIEEPEKLSTLTISRMRKAILRRDARNHGDDDV